MHESECTASWRRPVVIRFFIFRFITVKISDTFLRIRVPHHATVIDIEIAS